MSNCQPCSGGMKPLGAEQAANLLTRIDRSWGVVDDHHLRRKFTFGDFRSALAFANRVGEIAEEEAHHPDITIGYGRVVIELWTHAAGGLTSNDFILAAKIDRISPMP